MLVRPARPEDWPAVRGLLVQLGRPEPADDRDEEAFRRVFLDYLERGDAEALVAESDGRPVGFCDLEYRTRLNFTSPQGWIPDLVVDERERGRHVGAALIARAEELGRERGCWGMTLESATWRVDAHRFYVQNDWSDSGRSFTKALSDRVWPPPPPGDA